MSARLRPARGLVTARWGWQPDAWLLHGLPTWRPGRAPRRLVTSQQLRAAGVPRGDVAAAGQLHRPGPTRGPRGVVALWDLDEVRAHAALDTYHPPHRTRRTDGADETQEHLMNIAPDLAEQVASDAVCSGRSIRDEANYQQSVGLLTDRAVHAVKAYADQLERDAAALAASEREDDRAAAAPPPGSRWNPGNRSWEPPTHSEPEPLPEPEDEIEDEIEDEEVGA